MKRKKQEETYILKRSQRRTVALQVLPDGEVLVRAPLGLSKDFIDGFVETKQDWIAEKRKLMEERREAIRSFDYRAVRLFGQIYPVLQGREKAVQFDGKRFLVPQGADVKKALVQWYKATAKEVFQKRVEVFQQRMGVEAKSVKVSSAKTRWGSCSAEGNLNFSWKLLFAEGKTVDYVVVHELAHRKHMDHSDAFWATVARFMPDYEVERAKLRALKEIVVKEGWEA